MKQSIILLGILIFLVACHHTKKVTEKKVVENKTEEKKIVKLKSPAENIFNAMDSCSFKYNTLSAKFGAKYADKKTDISFDGSIRVRKDSVIWMMITGPLGIEVGRFIFTPDSIKFINKLKNTYYIDDYKQLVKFSSQLNYYTLQAILTNNLFFTKDIKNNKSEYYSQYQLSGEQTKILSASFKELFKDPRKPLADTLKFQHLIEASAQNYKLLKNSLKSDDKTKSVEVNYSNFQTFDSQLFPMNMALNLINQASNFNVDIEYRKITLNPTQNYPFSIGDKKRVYELK